MVIAVPDVTIHKITNNVHDFIIVASDGVFDRLTTEEVVSIVWDQLSLFNEYSGPN